MATSPAMLRHAFTDETDPEIAGLCCGILSAKVFTPNPIATKPTLSLRFSIATREFPANGTSAATELDGSLPLSPFEIALIEILADSDQLPLPEEHVQVLRRFDSLEEQVPRVSPT